MPGSRRISDSPRGSTASRISALRTTPDSARTSCQLVQHFVDGLRRQILVKYMVHHHHRSAGARCQALLFALEVNSAVRRALPGLDAELPLDLVDHFLRPTQHAGNVGAYRYVVAPHGFG